jgi:hypothetical protein
MEVDEAIDLKETLQKSNSLKTCLDILESGSLISLPFVVSAICKLRSSSMMSAIYK